ncbi:MAG: alpha/beta hydrolase, partial [Ignavibacteriota bacterium]
DNSLIDRPILFLHSALSTSKEFEKLSSFYENRKQIFLDFPSHGHSTGGGRLTTGILAGYVCDLLMKLEIYSVDVIGYSMGGYIGLELALIAPSMVGSIVIHATKFYWTEDAIAEALEGLDVEKIKARSQKGFEILSAMHLANGLENTVAAMRGIIENFGKDKLSEDDLKKIAAPILLSVGDSDGLVSLREITSLYESQEKSRTYLAIHPNSPHPISKLDMGSFTHAVREFWKCL